MLATLMCTIRILLDAHPRRLVNWTTLLLVLLFSFLTSLLKNSNSHRRSPTGVRKALPTHRELSAVERRVSQPNLRLDLPVPGGQLQVCSILLHA